PAPPSSAAWSARALPTPGRSRPGSRGGRPRRTPPRCSSTPPRCPGRRRPRRAAPGRASGRSANPAPPRASFPLPVVLEALLEGQELFIGLGELGGALLGVGGHEVQPVAVGGVQGRLHRVLTGADDRAGRQPGAAVGGVV